MTILGLFIFNFTAFGAAVDWTRLDMEMDYLKASTPLKSLDVGVELKLQRKAQDNEEGIADLDSAFDSISTRQATPQRAPVLEEETIEPASIAPEAVPTKKLKRVAPNGSIDKDIYESLVE